MCSSGGWWGEGGGGGDFPLGFNFQIILYHFEIYSAMNMYGTTWFGAQVYLVRNNMVDLP